MIGWETGNKILLGPILFANTPDTEHDTGWWICLAPIPFNYIIKKDTLYYIWQFVKMTIEFQFSQLCFPALS